MVMSQRILEYIEKLPPAYEEEIVDFLAYLLSKSERDENRDWSKMSIAYAMRDMEDEPSEYSPRNVKDIYQ